MSVMNTLAAPMTGVACAKWRNPTSRSDIEAALDADKLYVQVASGAWWLARRNGKTKTWKTRPNDYRVPIKCGLRTCGHAGHEIDLRAYRIAASREDAESEG